MERWNKLENMSTLSIKHTVPEDNSGRRWNTAMPRNCLTMCIFVEKLDLVKNRWSWWMFNWFEENSEQKKMGKYQNAVFSENKIEYRHFFCFKECQAS